MSTNYTSEPFDPADWISQAEAARLRGVSRQAIWRLVSRKRVRTVAIGGHRFVNRADILAFERMSPGRPSTKRAYAKSR